MGAAGRQRAGVQNTGSAHGTWAHGLMSTWCPFLWVAAAPCQYMAQQEERGLDAAPPALLGLLQAVYKLRN